MTIALNSAISGLKVAQQALDSVSKNISNASTPGYTRKILPQESLLIAGQGVGVRGLALIRNVDYSLIKDLNRQSGITEAYNIRLKYLDRIQDFQGSSDSGRSLSSQLTTLADTFTKLSSAPNDQLLLGQVVSTAMQTAGKINDFSALLTGMRNDTESDILNAINAVNQALDGIASLNATISKLSGAGQSTVDLEDQRDIAIKTVAKYVDISTFNADKAITVITKQGQVLVDNEAHKLFFQRSSILPNTYYPGGGINGLRVESASGRDITQTGLGGQLGTLFELRDKTLPQYGAQLDEFSQRLAERFQNEGLKLFTGLDGNVPPGNPNSSPPNGYVGFSSLIQVNSAVVTDPTLIRNGTTGNTELSGSNEVIRRIAQFTFGPYQYQKAQGTKNIGGIVPLTAGRIGTVDLSGYADFSTLAGATLPGSFEITLGSTTKTIAVVAADNLESLTGKINAAYGFTAATIKGSGKLAFNYNGPITLANDSVNLASFGFSAGTTTALVPLATRSVVVGTVNIAAYADLGSVSVLGPQLPGDFTLTIGGLPRTISIAGADTAADAVDTINTAFGYTVASIDSLGQMRLSSTSDIDIAAGAIDAAGLSALGFSTGTASQPRPNFQVQVGTRAPVTVSISPTDTSTELLAALNAVPGLTAALDGNGKLVLTPTDGGDLKITEGTGAPLAAMGMTTSNVTPTSFRQNNLGPDGTLPTGLISNGTLQDYISIIISTQSEEHNINKNSQAQEISFLQTLEARNGNISGVNIDQEMADLIRIQSAYGAAAKMISATQTLFDELLNSIR